MTIRPLLSALAFALAVSPSVSVAQTAAAPAEATPAPANVAPAAPAPAPAPAAPTEAPATPTERPTSYTMVAGDSLDSVAKKFGTSIHALAKLNKIPKDKYRKLKTGTVLQIPPAKAEAAETPAGK